MPPALKITKKILRAASADSGLNAENGGDHFLALLRLEGDVGVFVHSEDFRVVCDGKRLDVLLVLVDGAELGQVVALCLGEAFV